MSEVVEELEAIRISIINLDATLLICLIALLVVIILKDIGEGK